MDNHQCDCMSQGPALLPVRYAVVPKKITDNLPEWARSGALIYPPENENYHYALRALRRGFIYIYYPYQRSWEAWSVCDDGSLWKQLSANNVLPKSEPDCRQGSYNQGGKDFITLPYEVLENDIWIAFTQCPWLENTLDFYRDNEEERRARMQCLSSSSWQSPTPLTQTVEATEGNLSEILDYISALIGVLSPSMVLPYGSQAGLRVSQTDDDSYSLVKEVDPQETLYPWKTGHAANTIQQMRARGKKSDGTPVVPLMMALHDSTGITHELTGWTNDILALAKIFGDERALEFSTQSLITGVEEVIKKSAEQKVDEQLAALPGGSLTTHYDMDYAYTMYVQYKQSQHADEKDIMTREEFEKQAKEGQRKSMKSSEVANDLAKYKRMINQDKWDSFVNCNDTLTTEIDKQVEILIRYRCEWLTSSIFVATVQDFFSTDSRDNLNYREITSLAMAGLGVSKLGMELLDKWIDAYTTTDKANLVWRTHFYNDKDIMEEAEPLLAEIKQGNMTPTSESNVFNFFETNASKFNKIVKGFDKATAALGNPLAADSLFSKRILYNIDQHMATVGARVFSVSRIGPILDTMNDVIIRSLFSFSAGKTPAQTQVFFIKYFGWFAERRVYLNDIIFLRPEREREIASERLKASGVRFSELESKFSEYSSTDEGKAIYKSTGIKMLVLFFNVVELYNQIDNFKNEPSNYAKIASAILATTGGMVEIVMPAMEVALKEKNSLQYLKMTGAGCSIISAGASLGLDAVGFKDHYNDANFSKRWAYHILYGAKILSDLAAIANAEGKLMSALIERFGWETEKKGLGLWLGRAAAPKLSALGVEWIGFLGSWQFSLFLMVADYILTEYFSRDELQTWIEQSLFGDDNTLDTDGFSQEKIVSLTDDRKKSLMNCLRKMAEDNKEPEPDPYHPTMYWPFFIRGPEKPPTISIEC